MLPVPVLRRLVIAALTLVCAVMPSAASASSRHDATETRIVRALNHYRGRYGLPRLHASGGLHRAADAHSASMLRRRVLSHGAFGARVRRYVRVRRVGENLAWMNRCRAGAIVRMWMNSPGHRHVMLTRGFRRVGVGRRSGSGLCFVTADFATAR
jgi:uncharacterized protein YkwD